MTTPFDPDISHLTQEIYKNIVYDASEDTFLFVDALHSDIEFIQQHVEQPKYVVEIGSGSGYVSAFCYRLFHHYGLTPLFIATDINPVAAKATTCTFHRNHMDAVSTAVVTPFVSGLAPHVKNNGVDVLLFNPPYVPTPVDEVGCSDIRASWAGGPHGRMVIDELLPMVSTILSSNGVFYLVLVEENHPHDVYQQLQKHGFRGKIIKKRKAFNELLYVIRFWRKTKVK